MAIFNQFNVKLKDHTKAVDKELDKRVKQGMRQVGEAAAGHARNNCPVDTGRLKNSITYAVFGTSGKSRTYRDDGKGKRGKKTAYNDRIGSVPKEPWQVQIGSNVVYAARQEFEHGSKAHFLKNAIGNHNKQYEDILITALKD